MKPVVPYVDERKQVIFVECGNETAHNVINGLLFGVVLIGYLSLLAWLAGGGL